MTPEELTLQYREPDLNRFDEAISGSSLALRGARRVGKTTFLKALPGLLGRAIGRRQIFYIDLFGAFDVNGVFTRMVKAGVGQDSDALARGARLLSGIALQVAGLSLPLSLDEKHSPSNAWEGIEAIITSEAQKGPVLLLFDEASWVLRNMAEHSVSEARQFGAMLRYLRQSIPQLRMVLTGSEDLFQTARNIGAISEVNDLQSFTLSGLSIGAGCRLFDSLTQHTSMVNVVDLVSFVGGNPHWIRVLADAVRSGDNLDMLFERVLGPKTRWLFEEWHPRNLRVRLGEEMGQAVTDALTICVDHNGFTSLTDLRQGLAAANLGIEPVYLLMDMGVLEQEGDHVQFQNKLLPEWWRRYIAA